MTKSEISIELPALFYAADSSSSRAQTLFLVLMGLDLVLIILAAILGTVPINNPLATERAAALTVGVLATGVLLAFVLAFKRPEREWYGGRAAAESIRTLSWRYMMGVSPFHKGLGLAEANETFAESISSVLSERRQLKWDPPTSISASGQITESMREIRGLELKIREEIYRDHRIQDQLDWYSGKAKGNRKSANIWLGIFVGSQLVAFGIAATSMINSNLPLSLVGVLSTIASASVAWVQLRRHQELAQSYAIAAHELSIISSRLTDISTDEEFSMFVSDSENAMSREHTLWAARRDALR